MDPKETVSKEVTVSDEEDSDDVASMLTFLYCGCKSANASHLLGRPYAAVADLGQRT